MHLGMHVEGSWDAMQIIHGDNENNEQWTMIGIQHNGPKHNYKNTTR